MDRSKTVELKGFDISHEQIVKLLDYIQNKTNKIIIQIVFDDQDSQTLRSTQDYKEYTTNLSFEGYEKFKSVEIGSDPMGDSDIFYSITLRADRYGGARITVTSADRHAPASEIGALTKFINKYGNYNHIAGKLWLYIAIQLILIVSVYPIVHSSFTSNLISAIVAMLVSIPLSFYIDSKLEKMYLPIAFISEEGRRSSRSLRKDLKWLVASVILAILVGLIGNFLSARVFFW